MNIQLTDYGVSVLQETEKPLDITKFVLGSSFGYNLTGVESIQGVSVYQGKPIGPNVINANVYKYSISMDYMVGPFIFGEIALYDKNNKCVAVACNEAPIEKKAVNNQGNGTSMRIDIYLSMVAGQYNMWIDSIGSDIKYQIPVLKSIDSLPTVAQSDPNCYIIAPLSNDTSSVLAYCAGSTGLWNFDCYTFNNVREYPILEAKATSLTIDISKLAKESQGELSPNFYGDKIIEFSSGNCYSICRTVSTVSIVANKAVISFKTPLAIIPQVGDTLLYFSRSQISVSDLILPIATKDNLGTVIVGAGLDITPAGVLTPIFPVESVNGYIGAVQLSISDIDDAAKVASTNSYDDLDDLPAPYVLPKASADELGGFKTSADFIVDKDGRLTTSTPRVKSVNNVLPNAETGNIELNVGSLIDGLINPTQLIENQDLNSVIKDGIYYTDGSTNVVNSPFTLTEEFSLEVVATKNGCVQRISTNSDVYLRANILGMWSNWAKALTNANLPIATSTVLGAMMVGQGLTVTEEGVVSASVISFNGRNGEIKLTNADVIEALQPQLDKPGGLALLNEAPKREPNEDEDPEDPEIIARDNQDEMQYGRIKFNQLTFGALYSFGRWDAEANSINEDAEMKLLDGGRIITLDKSGKDYIEWQADGYIVQVTKAGTTLVDNLGDWQVGDLVVSLNGSWNLLGRNYRIYGTDNQIVANRSGKDITLSLAESGVTSGTYCNVKVDKYGRVIEASNTITAGTF